MNILRVIRNLINFRRVFKSFKVLMLTDKEDMCALSFYAVYKAEMALYNYYKSFDKSISYDDFVKLVRCSQGIREVLKEVLTKKLVYPDPNDFDFTLTTPDIHFFMDYEYEADIYFHIAEICSPTYGEGLIEATMLKTEMAYFKYINDKNPDDKLSWQEFINKLIEDEDFREPCYSAFKGYIVNLDFTECWYDKQVVGLLTTAKSLVSNLEKEESKLKDIESSGGGDSA